MLQKHRPRLDLLAHVFLDSLALIEPLQLLLLLFLFEAHEVGLQFRAELFLCEPLGLLGFLSHLDLLGKLVFVFESSLKLEGLGF